MAAPKRQSAFFRATQEAQTPPHSDTVQQVKSDTVVPPHSDTVQQTDIVTSSRSDTVTASLLHRETVQQMSTVAPSHRETKKDRKTSFYLTQEQTDKLDDLAYEHKKRTGQRINRNDIVRHLIDQCDIDSLANIQP